MTGLFEFLSSGFSFVRFKRGLWWRWRRWRTRSRVAWTAWRKLGRRRRWRGRQRLRFKVHFEREIERERIRVLWFYKLIEKRVTLKRGWSLWLKKTQSSIIIFIYIYIHGGIWRTRETREAQKNEWGFENAGVNVVAVMRGWGRKYSLVTGIYISSHSQLCGSHSWWVLPIVSVRKYTPVTRCIFPSCRGYGLEFLNFPIIGEENYE